LKLSFSDNILEGRHYLVFFAFAIISFDFYYNISFKITIINKENSHLTSIYYFVMLLERLAFDYAFYKINHYHFMMKNELKFIILKIFLLELLNLYSVVLITHVSLPNYGTMFVVYHFPGVQSGDLSY